MKTQTVASVSTYRNAVFMSLKLRYGSEMGVCESDYSEEKKSVSFIIRNTSRVTIQVPYCVSC